MTYLLLTLFVLGPLASGCYVMHLARGQLDMVNAQKPLEVALREERDPERRALLEEVVHLRHFAEHVVGLRPSDSYVGYYELDRRWLTLIVSAAPRDRLEPYTRWYPIAGRVPYRSFFDPERAKQAQEELERAGYDTYLHASPAYSTLGFFRDPVTTPMLERSPPCPPAPREEALDGCRVAGLAETLLHELTHQHLYVPGRADFNEQLASFVGRTAAIQYLTWRGLYDETLRQRLSVAYARQRAFEREVRDTAKRLERLYAQKLPLEEKLARRQPLFDELSKRAREIFPESKADWSMNNARILQYRRYERTSDPMRETWERAGKNWARFWVLVDRSAGRLNRQGRK